MILWDGKIVYLTTAGVDWQQDEATNGGFVYVHFIMPIDQKYLEKKLHKLCFDFSQN